MAGSISPRNKRVVKVLKKTNITSALTKEKKLGKKIVLAGGCFDVLHKGHIAFLNAAKKEGDILIILLESDENIKKKKGEKRPVNKLKERISVLSAIKSVNYVVPLSGVTMNEEYDRLMFQIKPDIVAITKGDPYLDQRNRQCEKYNAKLIQVIDKLKGFSTTALIKDQ